MCVSFTPEVVCMNALYAVNKNTQNMQMTKLKLDLISAFCCMLQENMQEKALIDIRYKYIHFAFDDLKSGQTREVSGMKFNFIGDTFYFNNAIDHSVVERVNYYYDTQTKDALLKTQNLFAEKYFNIR